ncbi:MAG: V-type ATPase subunit [Ruminococcus sp.]|nr:V-type ATPase subunit [Ruminococcus sp.]
MSLSYEFSIGSVRAKENSLFTNSDIEQLLACKDTSSLCSMLNTKGYGDGKTIDEIIENHTVSMWDYLKSIAPDFDIFAPFFYQNDAHNLKVVLKGTMADREYSHLLMNPCTIEAEILKEAVENRKFSLLPEWLSESADKAYDTLAHTGDARLSDAIIDKAVMQKMISSAEKFKSDFLKKYFNTLVFYNNIKIALRSSRTGTSRDYLLKALCDVADFRKEAVISASLKGIDALTDELSKYSEYDCKTAIEEYKNSPSAFERFVDNKLIIMAKESCKRTSEGARPLLGYYLGCEAEKKVIHIIASGIKTGTDTDIIRERLREIYG